MNRKAYFRCIYCKLPHQTKIYQDAWDAPDAYLKHYAYVIETPHFITGLLTASFTVWMDHLCVGYLVIGRECMPLF